LYNIRLGESVAAFRAEARGLLWICGIPAAFMAAEFRRSGRFRLTALVTEAALVLFTAGAGPTAVVL